MHAVWCLLAVIALGSAAEVAADEPAGQVSFKGIGPGKTRRTEVISRFGKPSKAVSRGGPLVDGISYRGEQAIEGTREACFFFDKQGVVIQIEAFPLKQLARADVVKVYGEAFEEGRTSKGVLYLRYAALGLVAYFEPETDLVRAFVFAPPEKRER